VQSREARRREAWYVIAGEIGAVAALLAVYAAKKASMELVVGLVGGFLFGIMASIIAWVISERLARPNLDIVVDESRAQIDAPDGAAVEFYHVKVRNIPPKWLWPGRRPAWACTATIEVFREDGTRAINGDIHGRWTSQPEPLLPVVSQGQPGNVPDPARLMQARKIDVHGHFDEPMSIAVKVEGEPECHIFTNESYYFHHWQHPAWRLGLGRYRVHVTVYYERGRVQKDFRLENDGPSRNDVRLLPWPTA
jgi:hypothetical protein